MELIVPILAAAVRSGTPILYATLGEIMTEKSGVLNLGLEGIMLIGAYVGFIVTYNTGSPFWGLVAAFFVGMAVNVVHAFLCISLKANQVICGLAMTMFGTGVSSLLGRGYVGETIAGLQAVALPGLSSFPVVGPVFFSQDVMVYISYLLVFVVWFLMYKTKFGLMMRAVGDSPLSAEAAGISVSAVRYASTLLGGGLVSLGGAYLTVVYSHMWVDLMTAGRGWIAVALVIFAIWNPLRAALGSYLFGGVEALQMRIQAGGTTVPAPLLMMLPYILTIAVLVVISVFKGRGRMLGAQGAWGLPF